MRTTTKRGIAVLLVWLQIAALVLLSAPHARAAGRAETPMRNPVIERTVQFGSFGFTGDLEHQRDGVDYVMPYYYSDDFFAPSAVNPNAVRKVMDFSDLEDLSMATLSKAFTLAVVGSSEGNVPADWSHKSKNGERFLAECGFENVYVNSEFNIQTQTDTLGYLFGTKKITVWDARAGANRTFMLVAVGIRGGGYGAEWASNLTIGDSESAAAQDKSLSGTYRHKGFQDGTDKVLRDLDAYLAKNRITGDVKYWICGYSRSGAIANLAAGAITDNAKKYRTTIDDIYAYTYEAAQGALLSEDPDGTRYPNIHNILNAMDLVPRISPKQFGHARLGVDYRMPFYGNTTPAENTAYYTRMRTVLPLVAAIADVYNKNITGIEDDRTEDAVITDSDPAVYPYDRPIQIKTFQLTNLFSGGLTQPVSNAASKIAPAEGLMFDQFLDRFVEKFAASRAWDAAFLKPQGLGWVSDDMTFDPMSHEQQYVQTYQQALRVIAGALFKQPGKGFQSLGGALDNAAQAIDLEALWNASGLAAHYALLSLGARYNYHVHEMIQPAATLINKIIGVSDVFESADVPAVQEAVRTLMPPFVWLFCEDRAKNNGEYLGTLADSFSAIFVTHIPEMAVSWLMSLDDVYLSDYRELTVPKATDVQVREFRARYGETLTPEGDAPVIARLAGGALTFCLDDRITVTPGTAVDDAGKTIETVTIRYPGNLDVRFDVTPHAGASVADLYVKLNDLAPSGTLNVRSTCSRADNGNITARAVDHDLLTGDLTRSARSVNDYAARTALTLDGRDTLHILARHGSNQLFDARESTYSVTVTEGKAVWQDYAGSLAALLQNLFAGMEKW